MTDSKNLRTAMLAGLVAVMMIGLGFAAVPLYNLFCRVTGFGGTTQRYDPVAAAETPKILSDTISVRFDANVSPKLPWKFYPEHPTDTVSIGARDMAIFIAENNSPHPITGTATFVNIENVLIDPPGRDGWVDGTSGNDVIDGDYVVQDDPYTTRSDIELSAPTTDGQRPGRNRPSGWTRPD